MDWSNIKGQRLEKPTYFSIHNNTKKELDLLEFEYKINKVIEYEFNKYNIIERYESYQFQNILH